MKVKMIVKMLNSGTVLDEEYDIANDVDPVAYCSDLIDYFNDTLRLGESPRELISVEVVSSEDSVNTAHSWGKTNLFTIISNLGSYDKMQCKVCGITGKRYGLSSCIRLDSKYKGKCYSQCNTAVEHFKKKGRKQ